MRCRKSGACLARCSSFDGRRARRLDGHSKAEGHSGASAAGAKASVERAAVRASERCMGHVVSDASRMARPAGHVSSTERNRGSDGGTINCVHIRHRQGRQMVDASSED